MDKKELKLKLKNLRGREASVSEAIDCLIECLEFILDSHQPERSKREDLYFEDLANEYIELVLSSPIYENHSEEQWFNKGVIDFSKWLNTRCGALNSMET